MKVWTVAMGKGGVGKTTTAAELAARLSAHGQRVLVIDLDEQGHAARRFGMRPDVPYIASSADVLTAKNPAEEIITGATKAEAIPRVWFLCGTQELERVRATNVPDLAITLREFLPRVSSHFDTAVIDTPPALGDLTLAALAAADVVVAPVEMANEALDEVDRLEQFIDNRVGRLNPGLTITHVIPTMHDGRRGIDLEVRDLLVEKFGTRVTTPVRATVAVKEAFTAGLPVGIYAPTCTAATDYAAIFDQILGPIRPLNLEIAEENEVVK